MWGIYQNIIFLIRFSFFHFLDFLPDGQHHVHEVIQFGKAFAFCRLYHKRAVNGEGEGGSMIAIVHQSFGNIILTDARFFVNLAAFQYHFMTNKAGCAPIYDTIRVFQTGCQVISAENSDFGSTCQSFRTHHADISVSDR